MRVDPKGYNLSLGEIVVEKVIVQQLGAITAAALRTGLVQPGLD